MKKLIGIFAVAIIVSGGFGATAQACSREQLKRSLFIPHDNITVLKLGEQISRPYRDSDDGYEVVSTAIYYEALDRRKGPIAVTGRASIRTNDCVTTKLSLHILASENIIRR